MPSIKKRKNAAIDAVKTRKNTRHRAMQLRIDTATRSNIKYRHVAYTGNHLQLILMSIPVGEEIPMETHATTDQFIRVESGTGRAQLCRRRIDLVPGMAIIIPAKMQHRIRNTSDTEPLQLYTLYAPPGHS